MRSKLRTFFSVPAKRKIIWIILAILILATTGGYTYYSKVYLTSQVTDQPTLQTATVKQGDLVIYASGTGTLSANSEASFGFGASGQVTQVNVKVGNQVKAGQVLAEISNTSAALTYEQAKRALAELTSPAGIATAQQNVAVAEDDLATKKTELEYLISPAVLTWEERLAEAQQTLVAAQSENSVNPSEAAQKKVKDSELAMKLAQANLRSAQSAYETYVKDIFTETTTNPFTGEEQIVYYHDENGKKYTKIYAPTQAEIDAARAAYALAKATLAEANNYLSVLNGEDIPANATGSALTELQNAKETLASAQENLKNTQLIAPIDGTVMSLDFGVGDMVSGSSTVASIADLSQHYLEIFLDESDWNNIQVGYPVNVTFDILPDKTFAGKVFSVDPGLYTESNSSVVRAYVQLNDAGNSFNLPLGTSAAVDVIGGEAKNAVLVPIEAIHEAGGKYMVFVQQSNGKLKLQVVEVGIKDTLNAEIKSGLKAGDVVTTGITETN